MLKIGSIEDNDGEYIIHREFYRQGMIFKDEEVYKFHKDQPCYSPELSDSVYTGNDFLELCNCQQDLADELFEGVDWQHPESLKEDWFVNGECGSRVGQRNECLSAGDDRNPNAGKAG